MRINKTHKKISKIENPIKEIIANFVTGLFCNIFIIVFIENTAKNNNNMYKLVVNKNSIQKLILLTPFRLLEKRNAINKI